MVKTTLSVDDFVIPNTLGRANFKVLNFKGNVSRKTKKAAKPLKSTVPVKPSVIDTRGLAQGLTKYHIYIDDDVQFKEQVGMIAEGMGVAVYNNQYDNTPRFPSTLSMGVYILQTTKARVKKCISQLANERNYDCFTSLALYLFILILITVMRYEYRDKVQNI